MLRTAYRTISYYKDKFGNVLSDMSLSSYGDIKNLVDITPRGKAILLKNADAINITKYNSLLIQSEKDHVARDMKFAKYQVCPGIFLIRNWSKCPELISGEIVAGGVNVIVEHNSFYYCILMKDKTKKYLTCPGGTSNPNDTNIGIRELFEETNSDDFKGIDLSGKNLDVLCKFYFTSRFFDIDNIRDTYTMNKFFTSTHANDIDYLSVLFDEKNRCDENCYMLNYTNHDETEFVYALKLNDHYTYFDFLMCRNSSILKQYNHPVSNLHIAMAQFNLFSLRNPMKFKSKIIAENFDLFEFPSNLNRLELFTS